jgi:homoserine dehydrogenase
LDKPIKVGIIGMGTVGSGVVKILIENRDHITQQAGVSVDISRIVVKNPEKNRAVDIDPYLLSTDIHELINDPTVPLIVELVGCPNGSSAIAKDWILQALAQNKHVVTANKEVIAKYGTQLLEAAEKSAGGLYYEASVAGGIPIIKTLQESLAGNRIQSIMGIINGTTNYMLTQMTRFNQSFDSVLKEAQRLGYAEADPTSDVEGYDAAYKIAILSSIAFQTKVPVESVHCEGITKITAEDIQNAANLGYVIKLVAIAKRLKDGIQVRVHPTFIPKTHPLASVNDAFNAIFLQGDAVGDLMLYGKGAGMLPTGSAVIADIIDAVRNIRFNCKPRLSVPNKTEHISSINDTVSRFYINTKVVDKPGVLADIATALGEENVSLQSVIQMGIDHNDPVSLVFITHEVKEINLRKALEKVSQLPTVYKIANVIRVEGANINGGTN